MEFSLCLCEHQKTGQKPEHGYGIHLGGQRPLPLGCAIMFALWEGKYYLTATLCNQAANIPFKQEFDWQQTSCPARSLK